MNDLKRISEESALLAKAALLLLVEHACEDRSMKTRLQRSRIYSGSPEEREAITHALWRLGRINWGGIQAAGIEVKKEFLSNSGGGADSDSLRGFGATEQHWRWSVISRGIDGDKPPMVIISFIEGDNGSGVSRLHAINEEQERWERERSA